jgi:hypothetical protein
MLKRKRKEIGELLSKLTELSLPQKQGLAHPALL